MYHEYCIENVVNIDNLPQNIDTTTSNSERYIIVVSTLNSKFTSQHIIDVVMTTSIQRCNRNVKFTTSPQLLTLRQLYKKFKMWTIDGYTETFPQLFLKVVLKLNNDMIFVWYAESILWHQTQSINFLSYSKNSQILLSNGLEISRMIICSLLVWTLQKEPYIFIALYLPSILKTTTFKEADVIKHCHKKSEINISN